MICLTLKPSQKNFRNNRSFFQLPSSLHLNPFDYAIWSILENKTNATSHPKIGLLKFPIEDEWNKMSEESILKASKLFQRCVDTIIEKNGDHIG